MFDLKVMQELQQKRESHAVDLHATKENIVFTPGDLEDGTSPVNIAVGDSGSMPLTSWAVSQLSRRFGLRPWVLWDGLAPTTAVQVLSELVVNDRDNRGFLARTVMTDSGQVCRAFVSADYGCLDNAACLEGVRLFFAADDHVITTHRHGGLSAERYMVNVASQHTTYLDTFGVLRAGVVLYNSEVGAHRLDVMPSVHVGQYDTLLTFPSYRVLQGGQDDAAGVADMLHTAWTYTESALSATLSALACTGHMEASQYVRMLCKRHNLHEITGGVVSVYNDTVGHNTLAAAVAISRSGADRRENIRARCEMVAGLIVTER
jgi:hypothetical protein